MRAALFVLVCVVPAVAVCKPSAKDKSDAKAANVRGLKLQQKQQYKDAEAEYRKAIALAPSLAGAHYNPACAAWLAGDADAAFVEIAWVANRGAYDDQARAAVLKAHSDPDLKDLFDNWMESGTWLS